MLELIHLVFILILKEDVKWKYFIMHEFIEALAGGFMILLLIFMGGYAAGGFWEDNDKK